MSQLTLTEVAAPGTPSTNKVTVYAKAGGRLYAKDDAGTEYDLTGGDGIAVLTGVLRADSGTVSVDTDVTDIVADMSGDSGSGGTAGLVPAQGAGDAAANKFLKADATWVTPGGSGDVSKVGTPVDNQVGVWTGDGTLEGDGDLTFTGQTLTVGTADTDEGILVLSADTDAGGKVVVHVEGDSDTSIVSYDIQCVDDDFLIGSDGDTDMLKFIAETSIQATVPVDVDGALTATTVDADTDFTVGGTVITDNTITDDGTLGIVAPDISLTATNDVTIPVSVGLVLGDGAEKIESDNTDLTINSGGAINLTAVTDIVVPTSVGVTFGTGEKIEGDDTDLTVTSGGAINLTAVTDVVVPANVGVTFGTGEKIEGNNTDLTVTSGGAINLTAVTDIVVPTSVGVTFGTGEKIEGDDTDLTITSGGDINLTATNDVNIPASVGLTWGDGGEHIEADNTNITITSAGAVILSGATVTATQAITDNHVVTVDGSPANTEIAVWGAAGIDGVALAAASDINTGTDAAKPLTSDALAGSSLGTKTVVLKVILDATALTTGDGKMHFTVPIELNGMNLVSVGAHVYTTSSSGLPTFQIHNLTDTSDMLSTVITIDETELDSKDAATPAVINAAEDDVVTGDVLRFDCDVAGTGTKGMEIRLGFRLP